mgnify:CR=1 FL=1
MIQDYYMLSTVSRDLIKGISTNDNDLVDDSLSNGASVDMTVAINMITGNGSRIMLSVYSPV